MSSVETGQMSAVETGQMSAAETGQMSSVETGQMSAVDTGQMSADDTGQMSAAEIGQMSAVPESSGSALACGVLSGAPRRGLTRGRSPRRGGACSIQLELGRGFPLLFDVLRGLKIDTKMVPKKLPTWFPKGTPKESQNHKNGLPKPSQNGVPKKHQTILIFSTLECGSSVVNTSKINEFQLSVLAPFWGSFWRCFGSQNGGRNR